MKKLILLPVIFYLALKPSSVFPQEMNAAGQAKSTNLFSNDSIIPLTLVGDFRELMNDRSETSTYHKFRLIYQQDQQIKDTAHIEVKTRGHFRKMRDNCSYPPLYLNFSDSTFGGSALFSRNDKLKLVMPCVSENFVVREWLVYKLYNLVTPVSLKARLVALKMTDAKKGKDYANVSGILIENEKDVATRNEFSIIKSKLNPKQIELQNFLTMSLFQYMIGNTDWSVEFRQNVVLMAQEAGKMPISMAYDFDHSGLVNAPYAQPAEALNMNSILERRYRGYCLPDLSVFDPVLAHFNAIKPQVYELYNSCTLLDDKYRSFVIKFMDQFYETINNPESFKKQISYPCDKRGTGNVVIKGLRQDEN